MIDKEKLLSDFFGNNYHKPMVVAPEEFMVIQKNGIMDLETLLEFETLVSEKIPNGYFIITNDEQVNAFAMKKNDISVVAINAGSIKKIMYSANLMMLSDKILLGIGDMSVCRENIIAEEYPITEDGDNVLLYISGDSTREAVGYMIANLAVRFMLYHEIGHHEEGHVKRLNDKYNLFCKEVSNDKERIELEERKKMEFEADMYAMTQIVNDFEILAEIWGKVLNLEVTYSEMFQLLVPALIIVKENLGMDVHNNEQIENSFYLPNIIRVVVDFATIFMDKKVKKVLYNDIAVMFETDSEYRQMFEKENNLIVFDSEGMLTEGAYVAYISLMIVQTEHAYCDIFVGNNYPIAFEWDTKAIDWFLHSYK